MGMPTETVYGLAGNAYDPEALARIFAVKERPRFDPLIVHVVLNADGRSALEQLEQLGLADPAQLGARAKGHVELLARAHWPGPLTLVLPRGPRVPDLATSGLDTVAVRAPRHPLAQELLRATGFPLAAPSANRFGRISPTRADHVVSELGDRIGLVLDGGGCEVGLESTVLAVSSDGALTLLRPGGVGREEIARLTSAEVQGPSGVGPVESAAPSPGMLASHYAPRKALHLLAGRVEHLKQWEGPTWPQTNGFPERIGLLAWSGDAEVLARRAKEITGCEVEVRVLSERGDAGEAARNLFSMMRVLDASEAEVLFAEPVPDGSGLEHAIRDRLARAAHR